MIYFGIEQYKIAIFIHFSFTHTACFTIFLIISDNRDKTELRELERSIYDDFKPIDVLRKQLGKFKYVLLVVFHETAEGFI